MSRARPWLKFYTSDWRADPGLRMCSYAARGLWLDMLTLMHEAEPYGHLVVGGKPPTAAGLASLLGGTPKEVTLLLTALEEQEVFSRNADGIIFSRRMIRDAEQAERDKANGKGGGNPRLKPTNNPPDNGGVNPPHKPTLNGGDKAHSQKPERREERDIRLSVNRSSQRATSAELASINPTLNDPTSAWFGLADKTEVSHVDGLEHAVVGGHYLDVVAFDVCQLAGINGHGKPVDWQPLVAWLRDGIEPETQIYPVIKRLAARKGYAPPRFLSYFDQAVRTERAA